MRTQQNSTSSGVVGSGLIGWRQNATNCVSAGWTRVGAMVAPASITRFPSKSEIHHSDLVWKKHSCNLHDHDFYSWCYKRIFPTAAMAIRCRTITSDSMDHVDKAISHYGDLPGQDPNTSPLLVEQSDSYWRDLAKTFFIDRQKAVQASQFMLDHSQEIAEENLQSKW